MGRGTDRAERVHPGENLIDQVRTRAHMPGITIGDLDAMREAVRYERRVEFPVEAVNFFDEVRWGTYKETKFQGQDVHGGQCGGATTRSNTPGTGTTASGRGPYRRASCSGTLRSPPARAGSIDCLTSIRLSK